MDKKIKAIIATVGSLLAIGAGSASYMLGWWNLPKAQAETVARVEKVEKKADDTAANLDKLIAVQTVQVESQKTMNELLIAALKDKDNG